MEVRLVAHISGTRNGQEWPRPGSVIDLPEQEALDMVRSGTAALPDDEAHRPREFAQARPSELREQDDGTLMSVREGEDPPEPPVQNFPGAVARRPGKPNVVPTVEPDPDQVRAAPLPVSDVAESGRKAPGQETVGSVADVADESPKGRSRK